jgi:hypothetical protein
MIKVLSKDKALEIALQEGYKARLENGVLIFNEKETKFKKIKKMLKDIGYNSSYGIKYNGDLKDGENEAKKEMD